MKYTYHINLNERGSFYADVRDSKENTVFEIKAGNELEEGESSIFEYGYMRHTDDIDGLLDYMIDLGIASKGDTLQNA